MKLCVLSLTDEARKLADNICNQLPECEQLEKGPKVAELLRDNWHKYDGFICIMATGIVVRSIAPLIGDKTSDPCIIVLDQKGEYVISLLSGHLGGGNSLTHQVAEITRGAAVITTASDVLGKTAIDIWARRNNLIFNDKKKLTSLSARQVNGHAVSIYHDRDILIPKDFQKTTEHESADILISYKKNMTSHGLYGIPRVLYLGIGCNRGTAQDDIRAAFTELCEKHRVDSQAICGIATIDVKNDEKGITEFAQTCGVEISYFSRDQLNSVQNVSFSPAAMKAVGAKGVAEPAALLAAAVDGSTATLCIQKMKWKDVTLAVAERMKDQWE